MLESSSNTVIGDSTLPQTGSTETLRPDSSADSDYGQDLTISEADARLLELCQHEKSQDEVPAANLLQRPDSSHIVTPLFSWKGTGASPFTFLQPPRTAKPAIRRLTKSMPSDQTSSQIAESQVEESDAEMSRFFTARSQRTPLVDSQPIASTPTAEGHEDEHTAAHIELEGNVEQAPTHFDPANEDVIDSTSSQTLVSPAAFNQNGSSRSWPGLEACKTAESPCEAVEAFVETRDDPSHRQTSPTEHADESQPSSPPSAHVTEDIAKTIEAPNSEHTAKSLSVQDHEHTRTRPSRVSKSKRSNRRRRVHAEVEPSLEDLFAYMQHQVNHDSQQARTEIDALEKELATVYGRLHTLEAAYAASQKREADSIQSLRSQEDLRKTLNNVLQTLGKATNDKSGEIQSLIEEKERYRIELSKTTEDCRSLREDNENMSRVIDTADASSKKVQEDSAEKTRDLETKIHALTATKELLEAQLSDKCGQLVEARDQLMLLGQQLEKQTEVSAELRILFTEGFNGVKDHIETAASTPQLQEALTTLSDRLTECMQSMTTSSVSGEAFQSGLTAIHSAIGTLQSSMERSFDSVQAQSDNASQIHNEWTDKLHQDLQDLRSHYETVIADLQDVRVHETQLAVLETQLQSSTAEVSRLRDTGQDQQHTEAALREKLNELQDKWNGVQHWIVMAKTMCERLKFVTQDNAALKSKVAELTTELAATPAIRPQESNGDLTGFLEEIDELKKALEEEKHGRRTEEARGKLLEEQARKDLDALHADLSRKAQRSRMELEASLRNEQRRLHRDNEQLISDLQRSRSSHDIMAADMQLLQEQAQQNDQDLRAVQIDLASAEAKVRKSETQSRSSHQLMDEVKQLRSDNSRLSSTVAELEARSISLAAELNDSRCTSAKQKLETKDMKTRGEKEIKMLKAEIDKVQVDRLSFEQSMDDLKSVQESILFDLQCEHDAEIQDLRQQLHDLQGALQFVVTEKTSVEMALDAAHVSLLQEDTLRQSRLTEREQKTAKTDDNAENTAAVPVPPNLPLLESKFVATQSLGLTQDSICTADFEALEPDEASLPQDDSLQTDRSAAVNFEQFNKIFNGDGGETMVSPSPELTFAMLDQPQSEQNACPEPLSAAKAQQQLQAPISVIQRLETQRPETPRTIQKANTSSKVAAATTKMKSAMKNSASHSTHRPSFLVDQDSIQSNQTESAFSIYEDQIEDFTPASSLKAKQSTRTPARNVVLPDSYGKGSAMKRPETPRNQRSDSSSPVKRHAESVSGYPQPSKRRRTPATPKGHSVAIQMPPPKSHRTKGAATHKIVRTYTSVSSRLRSDAGSDKSGGESTGRRRSRQAETKIYERFSQEMDAKRPA